MLTTHLAGAACEQYIWQMTSAQATRKAEIFNVTMVPLQGKKETTISSSCTKMQPIHTHNKLVESKTKNRKPSCVCSLSFMKKRKKVSCHFPDSTHSSACRYSSRESLLNILTSISLQSPFKIEPHNSPIVCGNTLFSQNIQPTAQDRQFSHEGSRP